jgi:Signal transduction histidine kinase
MKKIRNREPKRDLRSLYFLIISVVFSILLLVLALVLLTMEFLFHVGALVLQPGGTAIGLLVALVLYFTIGIIYTLAIIRFAIRPVKACIYGLYDLADGKFETRIDIGKFPPLKQEYSRSFNKLAEELQNTRMFRSDFINNFTHEFKSPIVAISGFAKLLQKGNVPPKKESEYLDIIVDESNRLSELATSVLALTKLKNQTTLSEEEEYNLSEQMRSCILLLIKKWEAKQLAMEAEFSEVSIVGNQELLQQVWINLLDNAVKFADPGGTICVSVAQREDDVDVTIMNSGQEIPKEAIAHIFDDFYQADTPHREEGNGIGLAIVKKVVQLHGGSVRVESGPTETSFTVVLPYKP